MDKTKATRAVEYTEIVVNKYTYTYVIRERDPEDEWDRDCHRYDNTIYNIYKAKKNEYHDLTVPFLLKKNTPYYLVYAEYTSGDSFGYDEGNLHFVDLFEVDVAAEACAKALREADGHTVTYIREDLTSYTEYIPWNGYFEKLENVYIKEVTLET